MRDANPSRWSRCDFDLLAEQVIDKYPNIDVETVAAVVTGDPGLLRRAIDNLVETR